MAITDLDGTNSGSIFFEKRNTEFDGRAVSLNFIPNLNPKAKYMLLAASIKLVSFVFVCVTYYVAVVIIFHISDERLF